MDERSDGVTVDPSWLDEVGIGLLEQEPDGTVVRVNRVAADLTGARAGAPAPPAPPGVRVVRHEHVGGRHVTLLVAGGGQPVSRRLLHDAELVRTIIAATPVGVCVTDEEGMFEQVNSAYERFYGYGAAELVGRHFTMVVPPEHRSRLAELHDAFIAGGAEVRGEWTVVGRDGVHRTILADACRILGADGRYRKVTFVVDITERARFADELARANARLEHLATHDALTRLPNRRRTLEALHDAVGLAARYGGGLVVAALDLDLFKRVNDTWGHEAGDEVLAGFGEVLLGRLRSTDTAGRVGGEEFVVVMPGTGLAEGAALVRRLQELVRERVDLPDGSAMTFSAGLTPYRPGDTAEGMLRRADEALYAAKGAGRDRVEQT